MKSIFKRRNKKDGNRWKIGKSTSGGKKKKRSSSSSKKSHDDSVHEGHKECNETDTRTKDRNKELPDVGLNDTFVLKVDDSSSSDGDGDHDGGDDIGDDINVMNRTKRNEGMGVTSNNRHVNISCSLDQFVEVEYEFDPASLSDGEAGTLKDDFSILLHDEILNKDKQTMERWEIRSSSDEQNEIWSQEQKGEEKGNQEEEEEEEEDEIKMKQGNSISPLSTDNDKAIHDHNEYDNDDVSISHQKILTKNRNKDIGSSYIYPDEILIDVKSQNYIDLTDDRSLISYDEITVSPSISFFLKSNREELRNEGLSIAGNDTDCISENLNCSTSKVSSSRRPRRRNDDITETDETKTTKAYSVSSSKHTTDTTKLSELREKKRLMERHFERRYGVLPTMIEVLTPKP